MSLDRSLKSRNALTRHRNVLSRAERLERLTDEGRWNENSSVFGLPKVTHRKSAAGKKAKKKEEAAVTEAAPAEAKPAT
jgi:small basic protein (TIGR04137 family)